MISLVLASSNSNFAIQTICIQTKKVNIGATTTLIMLLILSFLFGTVFKAYKACVTGRPWMEISAKLLN